MGCTFKRLHTAPNEKNGARLLSQIVLTTTIASLLVPCCFFGLNQVPSMGFLFDKGDIA